MRSLGDSTIRRLLCSRKTLRNTAITAHHHHHLTTSAPTTHRQRTPPQSRVLGEIAMAESWAAEKTQERQRVVSALGYLNGPKLPPVDEWPVDLLFDRAYGITPRWNTTWLAWLSTLFLSPIIDHAQGIAVHLLVVVACLHSSTPFFSVPSLSPRFRMCSSQPTYYEFSEEDRVATKATHKSTIYTIRATEPLPENECVRFSFRVRAYLGDDMDLGICGTKPTGAWMRTGDQHICIGSTESEGRFDNTYPVARNLLPSNTIVTVAVDTDRDRPSVEIWLDYEGRGTPILARQAAVDFWPIYPAAAFRAVKGEVEFVMEELPPK
eukprot:m.260748 g.260748  ORF g.260748 m.260748 type:complete len:323 (+) comp19219_c0_seq19:1462-2430(+)